MQFLQVYVQRGNYNFRSDPQVQSDLQSSCAAYRNSGYDKGHLAASGIRRSLLVERFTPYVWLTVNDDIMNNQVTAINHARA